ncbi:uncharacterized protein TNCV_2699341 [Trichonephila clavipes]|nr:uncharacterized protein TNCV_2699341 [Trichonephila clavipes]
MVINPGQTITDKNIGKLLSIAYFKAATVGNAIIGFKECGIEPHNPLVFSEHDFADSKTTDHVVVGDETKNNSAIPQSLVVENQHIKSPEEPELMANADSDASKKPVSVLDLKPHCLKQTQCEKKEKKQKTDLKHFYKDTQRNVRSKGKAEGRKGSLKKQRKEVREAKKGVK